ncbi:MAG TPA: XRE family transcriptional regulator [Burkholderiaceae bacterium]|nr:XRE family transcriptional regulator [Burkholderiaceae bacterium]
MSTGDLIRRARMARKLTQEQLAGRLHWGQNRLSNYERNERKITADDLSAIAQALEMPVAELMSPNDFGDGVHLGRRAGSDVEPVPTHRSSVPLLTWQQIASGEIVVSDNNVACPVPAGPKTFAARVRGNAMHNPAGRPSFAEDDLIFVDPSRKAEHKSLVIVRHAGQALFRQYLAEPEGAMLAALNPAWPDRLVRVDDGMEIVGVVIFGGYVP